MRKKKILFVINTLGRAGAEVALLSLFSAIDPNQYELSLYVMMAQGEMKDALPSYVHLKNPYFLSSQIVSEKVPSVIDLFMTDSASFLRQLIFLPKSDRKCY